MALMEQPPCPFPDLKWDRASIRIVASMGKGFPYQGQQIMFFNECPVEVAIQKCLRDNIFGKVLGQPSRSAIRLTDCRGTVLPTETPYTTTTRFVTGSACSGSVSISPTETFWAHVHEKRAKKCTFEKVRNGIYMKCVGPLEPSLLFECPRLFTNKRETRVTMYVHPSVDMKISVYKGNDPSVLLDEFVAGSYPITRTFSVHGVHRHLSIVATRMFGFTLAPHGAEKVDLLPTHCPRDFPGVTNFTVQQYGPKKLNNLVAPGETICISVSKETEEPAIERACVPAPTLLPFVIDVRKYSATIQITCQDVPQKWNLPQKCGGKLALDAESLPRPGLRLFRGNATYNYMVDGLMNTRSEILCDIRLWKGGERNRMGNKTIGDFIGKCLVMLTKCVMILPMEADCTAELRALMDTNAYEGLVAWLWDFSYYLLQLRAKYPQFTMDRGPVDTIAGIYSQFNSEKFLATSGGLSSEYTSAYKNLCRAVSLCNLYVAHTKSREDIASLEVLGMFRSHTKALQNKS